MSEQATTTTLTEDECWEVLDAGSVGRLATAVGGDPEIFPVSFGTAARTLYFLTKPGTKLVEMVVNNRVAFETDAWDDATATSVVVKGVAEIIESDADVADAESSGVVPFVQDGKNVWVRITPTHVTGRRLTR
ncbi:nitroimidazol reductase NimA-like FMN-containing flavoprotein (pyridoxamine 5'-phosphate oxidase superfamily) [Isoptericola jiangsuensis]|uniref:Nitroimidazol reductase NimA-like FMN-containing flavoprotein (Pyridoxamine 5'-phosphate oxidase superfamily) n=1 Tax=Isoptericola jiangsuensis TaxID=548579 RepID=A0A2A9ETQ0_9MICO|nr:pyridoxamine 5'-phosphate oxidase family protein [Isoptericola jiangsuensis]PFG41946.1 nitroimidazol reductase NimA-like FMN-containing flavoprotein (pyridoxamine 5'-phosphate oxidase superfamily) [Isoptericola jiangsuensis]